MTDHDDNTEPETGPEAFLRALLGMLDDENEGPEIDIVEALPFCAPMHPNIAHISALRVTGYDEVRKRVRTDLHLRLLAKEPYEWVRFRVVKNLEVNGAPSTLIMQVIELIADLEAGRWAEPEIYMNAVFNMPETMEGEHEHLLIVDPLMLAFNGMFPPKDAS